MPRMLIVDDEPKITKCLSEFFSTRGFAVRRVVTGRQAVAWLQYEPPDVVLLDVRMPDMSGIEVLKRARELCPQARIIMVTALDEPELREEADAYGAVGYVTKPFDFSEATWAPVLTCENSA